MSEPAPRIVDKPLTGKAAEPVPVILLVDDDEITRISMAGRLKRLGYRVIEAGDGVAGLAAIRAQRPDLVILDWMMPGPPWPKVKAGKSRLARALAALPDDTPLRELLREDRPAPDAELPRTGVSLAWERMLSSAFIRATGYGTRCSTVFTLDRHGWAHFTESTWNEVGSETGRIVQRFQIARA